MFFRITFAATLLAAPAFAQDLASGEAITAAISGNTVQGSMSASGAYTEFYAADGAIKGNGYAGTWTVEGETMCFDYGEGATCWNVSISGDQVTWINGDVTEGTGTILPGNPNGW